MKPDKILNKEKWQQDLQKAMDAIDLPEIESQSGLADEVKLLNDEANQMTKYMEFWEMPPDAFTEKEDK